MPREGTSKWKERNRSAGRWNVGWQKPPFCKGPRGKKAICLCPIPQHLPTYLVLSTYLPTNYLPPTLPPSSLPRLLWPPTFVVVVAAVVVVVAGVFPPSPRFPSVVRFFSLALETTRSHNFASPIFAETHSLKQALSTHPQSEICGVQSSFWCNNSWSLFVCVCVCVFFFLGSWLSLAFFISVYKLNRINLLPHPVIHTLFFSTIRFVSSSASWRLSRILLFVVAFFVCFFLFGAHFLCLLVWFEFL